MAGEGLRVQLVSNLIRCSTSGDRPATRIVEDVDIVHRLGQASEAVGPDVGRDAAAAERRQRLLAAHRMAGEDDGRHQASAETSQCDEHRVQSHQEAAQVVRTAFGRVHRARRRRPT